MQKLSIVIPAYNEEAFIGDLLERILAVDVASIGFEKEIVVVDDGSHDRTSEIAGGFDGVKVIRQENQGKGAAVQRGIRDCTGDWILVQDADLEYAPEDYVKLLGALEPGRKMSVYGSRIRGQVAERGWSVTPGRHERQSLGPWIAGALLTLWTALLYFRWITDTLTAYKLYPAEMIRTFDVKTSGFETDHELTAKLIRGGARIVEVPISYDPRTVEEGKKIGPRDGLIAVWTLLRFRFSS